MKTKDQVTIRFRLLSAKTNVELIDLNSNELVCGEGVE